MCAAAKAVDKTAYDGLKIVGTCAAAKAVDKSPQQLKRHCGHVCRREGG